jgi:hypothetical protein
LLEIVEVFSRSDVVSNIMKNILIAFLFFNSVYSLAQDEQLILTVKGNDLWFQSLKSSNILNQKIELINQRLISDMNVYIKWSFPDGITVQRIPKLDSIRKIRIQGVCKPLYVVKYKEKEIAFRIENPLSNDITKSVTELITENNIYGVEVWTDDKRKVLYGTSADCGVVFITTNNRKIFKSFKNLNLTNFYMDEIRNYKKAK